MCQSLIFNKIADSGTGAFLWILQNFSEHGFYETPTASADSQIHL